MKNNKGLTLLEIIMIIVVIGAAIPTLLVAFSRIVAQGADSQSVMVASNLAEEKLEEIIRTEDFNSITNQGVTAFNGNLSDYNYQITVNFVNENDLDTAVTGPTDFKRVQVTITKNALASFNLQMVTLISNLD